MKSVFYEIKNVARFVPVSNEIWNLVWDEIRDGIDRQVWRQVTHEIGRSVSNIDLSRIIHATQDGFEAFAQAKEGLEVLAKSISRANEILIELQKVRWRGPLWRYFHAA